MRSLRAVASLKDKIRLLRNTGWILGHPGSPLKLYDNSRYTVIYLTNDMMWVLVMQTESSHLSRKAGP